MLPIRELDHEEFEAENRKTNLVVGLYLLFVIGGIIALLLLDKFTS